VLGPVEVGDHEVDELYAEVVWSSKLDGQRYLAKEVLSFDLAGCPRTERHMVSAALELA